MVLTSREDWAKRVRHLVTQARAHPTDYVHDEIGFNYRLPNINAAVGCAQMECLDRYLERKREITRFYERTLPRIPGLSLLRERDWAWSSCWLNTLLIDRAAYGRNGAETVAALRSAGVEARRVWPPLHAQAPYRDCPHFGSPNAEWLFERGVNLPSSVGLADADLERVVEALRDAVR
jgi:dTDP-4-amino-4,6-dideoxygalactose transaminase